MNYEQTLRAVSHHIHECFLTGCMRPLQDNESFAVVDETWYVYNVAFDVMVQEAYHLEHPEITDPDLEGVVYWGSLF